MNDVSKQLANLQLAIRGMIEHFDQVSREGKSVEAYLTLERMGTNIEDLLLGLADKKYPASTIMPMKEALGVLRTALGVIRHGNNLVNAYLIIRDEFAPTYERCHQEFTALIYQALQETGYEGG
jgi:hypothetical protein